MSIACNMREVVRMLLPSAHRWYWLGLMYDLRLLASCIAGMSVDDKQAYMDDQSYTQSVACVSKLCPYALMVDRSHAIHCPLLVQQH